MTTSLHQAGLRRRLAFGVNLAVFLLSFATILIVANHLSRRDVLRWTVDATKTRAYSLSQQTKNLLDSLDGSWTIALLLSDGTTDPATRRQIDEVLHRYERHTPNLDVQTIDPSDPASLGEYESLIARLQMMYGDEIAAYDVALDDGEEAFEAFMLFAQQYSARLAAMLERLPNDSDDAGRLRARAPLLAQVASQGQLVLDEVRAARRVTDARPIPDYDGARSILASALWQWGNELADTAGLFRDWSQRATLEPSLRAAVSQSWPDYETMAGTMHRAADPLRRLQPLELSRIGTELQDGEAAVIVGPERATIIPANQLLPTVRAEARGEGVAFDRRFRGEQLISAAIRSLQIDAMPLIVFMHAEEDSMLNRREQEYDALGARLMLESSRYDVTEWAVHREEAPTPDADQQVVWIVIPPRPRRSFRGMPAEEQQLIAAVQSRLDAGDAVMLNVVPNVLHRLGRENPWEDLVGSLGVDVDTSQVVYELVRTSDDATSVANAQWLSRYDADHPIARAVNGRQTYFGSTVGVEPADDASARIEVLASIEPDDDVWRERLLLGAETREAVPEDAALTEPLPIMLAVERRTPGGDAAQRVLVVGAAEWLMSNAADAVVSVGGQRVALAHPGNYELMLASVAWLARQDDLIAPSPVSQAVARVTGVTETMRTLLAWLLVAGLPGLCLVLGSFMWFVRRM